MQLRPFNSVFFVMTRYEAPRPVPGPGPGTGNKMREGK